LADKQTDKHTHTDRQYCKQYHLRYPTAARVLITNECAMLLMHLAQALFYQKKVWLCRPFAGPGSCRMSLIVSRSGGVKVDLDQALVLLGLVWLILVVFVNYCLGFCVVSWL